jgi:hypothetical protein
MAVTRRRNAPRIAVVGIVGYVEPVDVLPDQAVSEDRPAQRTNRGGTGGSSHGPDYSDFYAQGPRRNSLMSHGLATSGDEDES